MDNRKLPDFIEGYGRVIPFAGPFNEELVKEGVGRKSKLAKPGQSKLRDDLGKLMAELGLTDGMTFSFHHHLRNGDHVLNLVMAEVQRLGLKNIKVAASSLFPCHAPLVPLMEDGTVTDIHADYISGPVAQAVSQGKLTNPAVLTSHGGRPRAIAQGDLKINVAFIAAPAADPYGNVNGVSGPSACGALGYAIADAEYADIVVAVTDHLEDYPLFPVEIRQNLVDYVVKVDSLGDPRGIVSGTTCVTRDPIGLKIAADTLKVMVASELVKDGLSFQTGAGGISLAVARELEEYMDERGIQGSFASGGITGAIVAMMEKGLFKALLDVQCFDLEAVRSYRENPNHLSMSGDLYGNPHNKGAVVNKLDIVILGATEVDLDFNVNVTTGSTGIIMGGSGGHSDTAAGADLTIIVSKLVSSRIPLIRDRVTTISTPGETVDVIVTDRGIAVNDRRSDLKELFQKAGLRVMPIAELKNLAEHFTGIPKPIPLGSRIVAVSEYRDGSVLDVIREVSQQP